MYKKLAAEESGQALVELVVAIALVSLFLTTFVLGFIGVREAFNRSSNTVGAKLLLQKESEALRSIKETAWNSFANPATYHTVASGNSWAVTSGTVVENDLTRGFTVSNVCRTSATALPVDCSTPGSSSDPSTKKIVASVSWSAFGIENISQTFYLTRNFGNNTWTQTTQGDFNAGTKVNTAVTNTAGGEVQLSGSLGGGATSSYGNKFLTQTTSSIGSLSDKKTLVSMRFTAQASKTVNQIALYVSGVTGTSPSYKVGIQGNTIGAPNGTYLSSANVSFSGANWYILTLLPNVSLTAGSTYHIVVSYNSGTINNSNFADIARTAPLNSIIPLTGVADNQQNTLISTNSGSNWTLQNSQPVYQLIYSDTTWEGNPFQSSLNVDIAGNSFYGEKFKPATTVVASDVSFYLQKAGTPSDSLHVVLQNADTNTTIEDGTLTVAGLLAGLRTYTFTTPRTLTAGTNYRIYLKSSASVSPNAYRAWIDLSPSLQNFKTTTYDSTNSQASTSSNSGTSWTDFPERDLGNYFFTVTSPSGFSTSGTFESQTFDASSPVGFNYLTMTQTIPASTTLKLQIATNNDNSSWTYLGPDGTAATYFTPSGAISLGQSGARYLRFKAFFTGNGTNTPVLNDTTLNYSP